MRLVRLILCMIIAAWSCQIIAAPAPNQPAAAGDFLRQLSTSVEAVAGKAGPAVVAVSVSKPASLEGPGGLDLPPDMRDFLDRFFGGRRGEDKRGDEGASRQGAPRVQGVGSGFIIDLNKGYIVTNNHVVESADTITVRLSTGVSSIAKVVGRDRNTDLAVIQLADKRLDKKGLATLAFADSDKVKAGDVVLAVGAPFGLEASLSLGIVSATGRGTLGITQLGDFLQTDAAVNPGNSGGPLVDADGQVVGVNTAIFSQTGGYAGIGFSIPSNMARLVVSRLIEKGKVDRGYLGLSLQAITPQLRLGLGVPPGVEGAVVANVQEGSPAAKAGLVDGDVITALNGRALRNEMDLVNTIGLMEPGQKVELKFLRGGKENAVTIKLDRWPETTPEVAAKESPNDEGEHAGFGLSLSSITPELRERFGLKTNKGAVVVSVEGGSAAELAGITSGDVILSVDRKPVSEPSDVRRLTKNKSQVLLRIERQGTYFFASLNREGQTGGTSH